MSELRFWPAEPAWGPVRLRPLRRGDRREWEEVRRTNRDWLLPWEATSPDGAAPPLRFADVRRFSAQQARAGALMPFAIEVEGRFRGQLTVSGFQWGALSTAAAGYWIDRRVAGRGLMPIALALAVDHCFALGLHRIEVNIRPENAASLRVVDKLGFRDEGLRAAYMHIDGAWRDHRTFALLAEDVPSGLLAWYAREYGLVG